MTSNYNQNNNAVTGKSSPFFKLYESNHQERNEIKKHSHSTYQILYVLKGNGMCFLGGGDYELESDSLLIIAPSTIHSILAYTKMTVLVLEFDAGVVSEDIQMYMLAEAFEQSEMRKLNTFDGSEFRQLLRKMLYEQSNADHISHFVIRIHIAEMIAILIRSKRESYVVDQNVPLDNAEQLEAQPDVELVTALGSLQTGIFNEEEGVFTDPLMRQAVNTAIDNRAIMLGAYVSEEFFTLDAGIMFEDQVDWHSLAGEEYYFQNDPDQALEMLDEAGYDGEEVVILVARDYDALYNTAVVLHQQLEELGMNAVLEVTDWPTYLELSDDPSNFDIAITSFSTRLIPHQYPTLSKRAAYVGWTKSEELDRLLDEIKEQPTQEEAFEVFEELQVQFYEDMPMLNIGKSSGLTGIRSNVVNYEDLIGPILWNTTIE